jgi:hypothetical protein
MIHLFFSCCLWWSDNRRSFYRQILWYTGIAGMNAFDWPLPSLRYSLLNDLFQKRVLSDFGRFIISLALAKETFVILVFYINFLCRLVKKHVQNLQHVSVRKRFAAVRYFNRSTLSFSLRTVFLE